MTSSAYLKFNNQTGLDLLTTVGTILTIGYANGAEGVLYPAITSTSSSTGYGVKIFVDAYAVFYHGAPYGLIGDAGGSAGNETSGAVWGSSYLGQLLEYGFKWDGTNGTVFWGAGNSYSTANTHTPPIDASYRRTLVGSQNFATGMVGSGNVLALGFNRLLSQAEYAFWSESPWAVVQLPQAKIFALSIAGSAPFYLEDSLHRPSMMAILAS
jgi:hypothetical protein